MSHESSMDRPHRRSLSVVIPAFNERRRLPGSLQTVHAFLRSREYTAEVIVVDDGSLDGTSEALTPLLSALPPFPAVRLLRSSRNRGKGRAVREGVLASSLEAILVTDADLSTPIDDIDLLWPRWDRGFRVIVGSRRLLSSRVEHAQPLFRRVLGLGFSALARRLHACGVQDTQCGFKLFERGTAMALFGPLCTSGLAFDVEVLSRARRAGISIAEVGVRWRDVAGTHVRPVTDSLRMLWDIIALKCRS